MHYSYKRISGAANVSKKQRVGKSCLFTALQDIDFVNIFFGNSGFFLDTFEARQGEGIVFLHAYGNLFNKVSFYHSLKNILMIKCNSI